MTDRENIYIAHGDAFPNGLNENEFSVLRLLKQTSS